jgi:hypothetical protein
VVAAVSFEGGRKAMARANPTMTAITKGAIHLGVRDLGTFSAPMEPPVEEPRSEAHRDAGEGRYQQGHYRHPLVVPEIFLVQLRVVELSIQPDFVL